MTLATQTKALYRANLHEPMFIRRITGSGSTRVDASWPTIGRLDASNNSARKELLGGIAQQDIAAVIYAQHLIDAGMTSDVRIGDILIDQDGYEHAVYEVQARRVEGTLVAYELTVRA